MKLTILILSYNTKDLLEQTLKSVGKSKLWLVWVIDNGSTDGSQKMVQERFSDVKLTQNKKNIGFAAANNIGLKKLKTEYVMLLNSDVIVADKTIEKLIKYMDDNPKVGAITPKVVLPDGDLDLACHRGMPTPWNSASYFLKMEKLFPKTKTFGGYHQLYKNMNEAHEVESTSATAMIVRKKVIDEVGLLDERFFFYAEDLDWCKRMNEAGYVTMYYPEVEVIHLKSQSGKGKDADTAQAKQAKVNFYETMKQFYDKHYQDEYPSWVRWTVFKAIDAKQWLATK